MPTSISGESGCTAWPLVNVRTACNTRSSISPSSGDDTDAIDATSATSEGECRFGAGSRLRSILALLVRGHSRTLTTIDGTMYAGSAAAAPASAATRPNGTAAPKPPPPAVAGTALSTASAAALAAAAASTSAGSPGSSTPTTSAGLTYATSASACTSTTASSTPGSARSACSISPSSIRWPRSFTWKSSRPPNSSSPSAYQRTRSPVR
eukprot:scaffold14468_cov64-Phaeocystis_antarctica.AAC.7